MRRSTLPTERRRALALAILLVCGVTHGCDTPTESTLDADAQASLDEARDQLREARARWEEAGSSTYSYTLRVGCQICTPDPVRIEVEDGTLTSSLPPDFLEPSHVTVPGLFRQVEEDLDALEPGGDIEVTYDGTGVPTTLRADPRPMTEDLQRSFTVEDLDVE